MVLFILVHFAALCSVVFTHKDSLDKGSIQTSFELRDVERSDGSGIVSSFQKTLRCVNSGPSNLKLAAFNVRTFGTKKMSTPGVPEVLVKIILRYDIILIQEIRDSSGKAIMDLLSLVNKVCENSTNNLYSITISPRLGRTSSKEQYAFLYRKNVLSVTHTYVYDDGNENLQNDTFEREPYIVHFTSTRTRISEFVLVAIHTSPSKANQEIQQLVAVYDDVIKQLSITNVIILGDLNAACSYMTDRDWKTNHLANDNRFHWLISDCVDTTVNGGLCAYDRFIVAGDAMLNATMESSSGSYKYDQHLNINKTMASLVSDHYPIEMQIYSKDLADYSAETVEYTFKMKQHPSLSRYKVYGMRKKKAIKAAKIAVETTYGATAITRVTFRKDFGNLKEAMNALRDIQDIFLIANMVSIDQIQNAKFHLKGAWEQENQLLVKKAGAVKVVCETNPTTTCWIAVLLT